jgi:hypothetical protein
MFDKVKNVLVFDALGIGMVLQSIYVFNIMYTSFNYLVIKYFTSFLFISIDVVNDNYGDWSFLFIMTINIVTLACV